MGMEELERELLTRYGVTLAWYEERVNQQHNLCVICNQGQTGRTHEGKAWRLCIDHNHTTGQARGLLCTACNRLIGLIERDRASYERWLSYYERHNKQEKLARLQAAFCYLDSH